MTINRARSLRRHMSPPEAKLWNLLRREPLAVAHFRRQVPIGPYYADFASHRAKLVLEVDGGLHSADPAVAYDIRRTDYLTAHGYRVRRLTTVEILGAIDAVGATILAELEMQQSAPIPPP